MRWIREDNGNGERIEVTEQRVKEIVAGEYTDVDKVIADSIANGNPIRCTFATYIPKVM